MSKSAIVSHHQTSDVKLKTYVIGFVVSVLLTLTSYYLVVNQILSHYILVTTIIVLALVQFTIQIIFFLHLGNESKPRWKTLVFCFMFIIVIILVVGSLWIMNNLNYNTMNGPELLHHMRVEEGL